jgi:type I restriction enzyme, R subunit
LNRYTNHFLSQDGIIASPTGAPTQSTEDEKDLLSNIIKTLNETYGLDLSEDDNVDMKRIETRLNENEKLKTVMLNRTNTDEGRRHTFDEEVDELLLDFVNTKVQLYNKLTDVRVNAEFKKKWFAGYKKYVEQTAHP